MFCPSCGSTNGDGSAFCTKCGTSLSVPAQLGEIAETTQATSPSTSPPGNPAAGILDTKNAQAEEKAAKARAKALRPWASSSGQCNDSSIVAIFS
jgi:hypothetical protein